MAASRKRKLPSDFHYVENAKRRKVLESGVEEEFSNSQIVKYNTKGYGNCFFHAVFGENSSGVYKTDKAQAMRQEWYRFLGQFKSLSDPKMPNVLKGHLKDFFEYMLNNIWKMPNVSKGMKELIGEINKKVDDIINKSAERKNALKNKIIEKFSEDEEFRREIYEIIRRSINERNERNVHSPKEQRDLLNIEDLLKKENEKILCDRIDEELESCAYILDTTLTEEKYKEEYVTNNDIILDSVLDQEDFYQTYLEAIQKQGYFVFHGEIGILASLSNTEIEAYFEGQEGTTIYKPDLNMINPEYVRKDELWNSKERETIYLEGNHYSRAKIVTQELIKQQQEHEDFLLAKQLQIDEILEYCNLSKDISERAEVEKRFDELLAKNADGKISDVVGQCINDVQQSIKCLEEPVLSRRCSVEEAHVEKAFHQQQQILAH